MSYSSLWLIDKNYIGNKEYEFPNSWLFSPIIGDILSEKYLPKDKFGFNQSLIGFNSRRVWNMLNDIMNNSDKDYERICWEMSNEAIFFSKDKNVVAKSIRDFLSNNNQYGKDEEDGICILKREHIVKRWNEIANIIDNIDENKNPYFVFKCTSVDDSVWNWFNEYDETTDKCIKIPITSRQEILTEFVVIKNGKIVDFIKNNKMIGSELESKDRKVKRRREEKGSRFNLWKHK